MDKFKRVAIDLGLGILALITIYEFSNIINSSLFTSENKQNPTHTLEIREVSKPPITIRDTITKVKTRSFRDSIYVPYEDSVRLVNIIQQRDSINELLKKANVSESVRLDTIVNKDTVNISYESLRKEIDFSIRFAPKNDTTITIYKPTTDFKTLALAGVSGVIVGILISVLIK